LFKTPPVAIVTSKGRKRRDAIRVALRAAPWLAITGLGLYAMTRIDAHLPTHMTRVAHLGLELGAPAVIFWDASRKPASAPATSVGPQLVSNPVLRRLLAANPEPPRSERFIAAILVMLLALTYLYSAAMEFASLGPADFMKGFTIGLGEVVTLFVAAKMARLFANTFATWRTPD
jgi:hypothetical protein